MDRAVFSLILAALWLTFAGYVVLVADFKSGKTLVFIIAVIFGLYNVMRFLLESRRTLRRETPSEPLPYEERNPDLDFDIKDKELDDRSGQGP